MLIHLMSIHRGMRQSLRPDKLKFSTRTIFQDIEAELHCWHGTKRESQYRS